MPELRLDEIKELLYSRIFYKVIDAIEILGNNTDSASNQMLITFLIEKTNDKFYENPRYMDIVTAIQKLPHKKTIDSLIIQIKSTTKSLEKRNILRILGILGSKINHRFKRYKEIGRCLLEPFLKDYDYKTKRLVATYLGKIEFKPAIPVIIDEIENKYVSDLGKMKLHNTLISINSYKDLLKEFPSKKEKTKLFILDVLEYIGQLNKDFINFLEDIISFETNNAIRKRAILLIGMLNIGELSLLLVNLADYDSNVDIRFTALTTFYSLLIQKTDPWLEKIASYHFADKLENDHAGKIRSLCAELLGKLEIEDENIIRALIAVFRDDSSKIVRESANITLNSKSEKLGYSNVTELINHYEKNDLKKSSLRQKLACFKMNEPVCPKNLEENSNFVFIAMPFREEFEKIYNEVIKPTLLENGFYPKKVNEEPMTGDIMCSICRFIQQSKYAIINISNWNANVTFELGLVWGLGKKALLLKEEGCKDVPADLRSMLYVRYKQDKLENLKKDLDGFIKREFAKEESKESSK